MITVYLEGVGCCGPGLPGWSETRPILAEGGYSPSPAVVPAPELLNPNERRRAVPLVRLALAAGWEAICHSGREAGGMATVFASSGGDGETVCAILEALASPAREVSPTRFHNSVHNAPSGYWSMATGCREPTTSLTGYDSSFAAGLLEAACQAAIGDRPVLLIAYDLPFPPPLHALRTLGSTFGAGMVLSPARTRNSLARLELTLNPGGGGETVMADPALEEIRTGNPAARGLPLLAAIARGGGETVSLAYHGDNALEVAAAPCP